MTPEKDYSIISVNSDDEDEIVIQAGATSSADDASVCDVSESGDEEAVREEQHAKEQHVKEQHAKDQNAKKSTEPQEDGYRETTLDDLKSGGPMPKTRMAIILIAVALITLFVVYYLFLR